MTVTKQIYDELKDYEHASSMPIDVAIAAKELHTTQYPGNNVVAVLKTVSDNELNEDSTVNIYRVRKSGGVLLCGDRRSAFAFPFGRLGEILTLLCENTEYIVVERAE